MWKVPWQGKDPQQALDYRNFQKILFNNWNLSLQKKVKVQDR